MLKRVDQNYPILPLGNTRLNATHAKLLSTTPSPKLAKPNRTETARNKTIQNPTVPICCKTVHTKLYQTIPNLIINTQ